MANDDIARPGARFHAWQNNFVRCVNGHLGDLALAAGNVVDLNNSAATCRSSTVDRPACAARSMAFEASPFMLIRIIFVTCARHTATS